MGRLGAYFPKFCNLVNRNGSRVETTNDPTDRIVFCQFWKLIKYWLNAFVLQCWIFIAGILGQMVKITQTLISRLEISPKVGFSVKSFEYPIFQFLLSKVPTKKWLGGSKLTLPNV